MSRAGCRNPRAVPPAPKSAEQEETAEEGGYLALLGQGEVLKIMALGTVTFAPIVTITGLWGGPYLQQVAGLSPERAGAASGLLGFSQFIVSALTTQMGGFLPQPISQ